MGKDKVGKMKKLLLIRIHVDFKNVRLPDINKFENVKDAIAYLQKFKKRGG